MDPTAPAWRLGDPRSPWSPRRDGAILAGLAAFALATRLATRSRYLNGWDAALYALALEEYDVHQGRPHPPGSPVYVALARILHAVVGEANAALVLLSILATLAAIALLYTLMRTLGSPRAALAASLLFALAPVSWYMGVTAFAYMFEAAAGLAVALLAWRARGSDRVVDLVLLGAAWALAVGIRQSLLFYLAPLVVWALWCPPARAKVWARRSFTAAAVALPVALAWYVPMVALSGGWARYTAAADAQSRGLVFAFTVFSHGGDALRFHLARMAWFLEAERVLVPVALLALAAGAAASRAVSWRAWRDALAWPPGTAGFLLAWSLPPLLFHVLIFNGIGNNSIGYVLAYLPVVYGVAAWVVDAAARLVESQPRRARLSRAATWLALPLLLAPAPALVASTDALLEREVRSHDRWAEAWMGLSAEFPPNETAILSLHTWAHAKWYFPDFILWSYMPPIDLTREWVLILQTQQRRDDVPLYEATRTGPLPPHPIPDGVRRVVLMDFQLAGEQGDPSRLADGVEVRQAFLEDGWRVLYFDVDPERGTIEDHLRDWPLFVHP